MDPSSCYLTENLDYQRPGWGLWGTLTQASHCLNLFSPIFMQESLFQSFIYSPCIHSFVHSFIYLMNVNTLSTNIVRGPHENSIYTFMVVVF